MSPFKAATVTSTTVVKAVSLIGMAVGAYYLVGSTLAMMIAGMTEPIMTKMMAHGAIFLTGLAGWHLADRVAGKVEVNETKAAQEAELARLQSAHGRAL